MADEHTLVERKGHTMMHTYICIHPLTNVPAKCQPSTPRKSKKKPRQGLKTHGHYDKVKSRSYHDVAHLQLITNIPTKYQLPIPYGFQDIARSSFKRSRSLQ